MSKPKKIDRREFLRLAAMSAAGAALASCGSTPVPPTATPEAPTAAPAIVPTTAPATGEAPKIGSQLIGKLEGPEIIRDVAQFPKKFGEAPSLADLVKAGTLPSVDKRLPNPDNLMVIKPLHETGQYGGTWRRAFTGPADREQPSTHWQDLFVYADHALVPKIGR